MADGELAARPAARVRTHLAVCRDCRARLTRIESEIADLLQTYRQGFDPKLPPIADSRTQLRAQLTESVSKSPVGAWHRFLLFPSVPRFAVYLCAVLLVAAVGGRYLSRSRWQASANISIESKTIPNRSLTPGATRNVALSNVCAMAHEEVVVAVSQPLRQEVFREYGIANPHADHYEIDYLITPGLGGADNIRNLWPEPDTALPWNSRVKDQLEEHLHQMVCSHQLDLSKAQQEISTNWIAAYKKYFHTSRPLASGSDIEKQLPG